MASLTYENENSVVMDESATVGRMKGKFATNKASVNISAPPRKFGDISNRAKNGGIHADVNRELSKKETKKLQADEVKVPTTAMKRTSPNFDGMDFRPEIKETEDYDDVLPPSDKLTNDDINKFVRTMCGIGRKYNPVYETDVVRSPLRSSSSLDLHELCPIKEENPNITIQPVEEDFNVFEVPSFLWD